MSRFFSKQIQSSPPPNGEMCSEAHHLVTAEYVQGGIVGIILGQRHRHSAGGGAIPRAGDEGDPYGFCR